MTESEIATQRSNQTAEFQNRIAELEDRIKLLLWGDNCKGEQLLEFGEEINKRGARINELESALAELREAVSPGRFEQPASYYVGVAQRRRQMELESGRVIRALDA